MDGHGAHAGVDLGELARLAEGAGAADVAHVADAVLRHVQPLGLDAHVGHVLPHVGALDLLHRLVRLVHVAHRQVVAEAEERLLGDGVHVLQAGEVAHHAALHVGHVGQHHLRVDLLEVVDVGDVDAAGALVGSGHLVGLLEEHAVVGGAEEGGHLDLVAGALVRQGGVGGGGEQPRLHRQQLGVLRVEVVPGGELIGRAEVVEGEVVVLRVVHHHPGVLLGAVLVRAGEDADLRAVAIDTDGVNPSNGCSWALDLAAWPRTVLLCLAPGELPHLDVMLVGRGH
mmetsp:Transcript_22640/g.49603  ORF Transcript_22640/g.49603 Transcript_22640/m.49603 type:complete len:284 (-) Transcript_22640:920-1771(-)